MNADTLLYAAGEIVLLTVCTCIYLIFYVLRLRKLVAAFEEKVIELRRLLKETKETALARLEEAKLSSSTMSYGECVDQQIGETRRHHEGLSPDKGIELDMDTDVPIDRQIAALRFVFLSAEKDAIAAGEDDEPNWDVLHGKLLHLINFYQQNFDPDGEDGGSNEDHAQEIENYKKHIANLEKFKKLFFDMEKQFLQAKKDAQITKDEILALTEGMDGGADMSALLDQYESAYDGLGGSFDQGREIEASAGPAVVNVTQFEDNRERTEKKVIITHQEEVTRLRKMMVNQHNVIAELKKKLRTAHTAEEKEQLILHLTAELEKQERFLGESETCIQLLEQELAQLHRQMDQMKIQVQDQKTDSEGGFDSGDIAGMSKQEVEGMISSYVEESRDMLQAIGLLEKENEALRMAADAGGGGGGEEVEELQVKLSELQTELIDLQTQHIELEERYIELKMG